jgi:hypothetical protein
MDCRNFEDQVESLLEQSEGIRIDDETWQHFQACHKCRDRYSAILRYHAAGQAFLHKPKAHISNPIDQKGSDQLSDPVEFKNAPISFTLVLDGREEAVKVVEPEMDVPLPEGGRLVVEEKETMWCDVRFAFNPDSDRPYELHFKVLMGTIYSGDHLVAFGMPVADDRNLLSQYKMEIVARGGITAWIEMTQGKARLVIKSVLTDSIR